jgi:hypothetical protein
MDSFHWMSTVGDPTYLYHRASAQFWGLLVGAPSLLLVDRFDKAESIVWLNRHFGWLMPQYCHLN